MSSTALNDTLRFTATGELATVSLDGRVLAGELRSVSVEIIAMHSAIYCARPHVGAILHTHSPAATAFSVAHRPLPCRTEPMLRFGQAEEVPVVPWGPRGSDVSIRGIADVLERRPTTSAVLLANHGLLVFGPDAAATGQLVVAIEEFAKTYGAKFPKAVAKITDDREELLAFYDFPAEHWIRLRTTNPIEATFSTVKLRTKVTRGAGSPAAALAMVFKLVESAQARWRAITGAHLVALVRAGARFENGVLVEREELAA